MQRHAESERLVEHNVQPEKKRLVSPLSSCHVDGDVMFSHYDVNDRQRMRWVDLHRVAQGLPLAAFALLPVLCRRCVLFFINRARVKRIKLLKFGWHLCLWRIDRFHQGKTSSNHALNGSFLGGGSCLLGEWEWACRKLHAKSKNSTAATNHFLGFCESDNHLTIHQSPVPALCKYAKKYALLFQEKLTFSYLSGSYCGNWATFSASGISTELALTIYQQRKEKVVQSLSVQLSWATITEIDFPPSARKHRPGGQRQSFSRSFALMPM